MGLKDRELYQWESCCIYNTEWFSCYGRISNHVLTTWNCGRVTHICVGKLANIGSDNGLSPARRQAIIWTNDGILLTGPLETNFSDILIEIHTFLFMKMHLKLSYVKWQPFVSASMCSQFVPQSMHGFCTLFCCGYIIISTQEQS